MRILPKWLSQMIFGEKALDTRPRGPIPVAAMPRDRLPSEVRAQREADALAAARAPFLERMAAQGLRSISEMEMDTDAAGAPMFLNADGLVFGTPTRAIIVSQLHEHSRYSENLVAAERLEKAGKMIVGEKSMVIYDNDGSLYVGQRFQQLGNTTVDVSQQLSYVGYETLPKRDRLDALADESTYVIGGLKSRVPDSAGDTWEPDHTVHLEAMAILRRPALTAAALSEKSKYLNNMARDLKIIPPRNDGGM